MLGAQKITVSLMESKGSLPLDLWQSLLWTDCLDSGMSSSPNTHIECGKMFVPQLWKVGGKWL